MLFRQLFDQVSSTYTYLLADEATHEAVLVDPVFEQHKRDAALVRELGLQLTCTLDTHCHADHVTGAWLMKAALGSKIGLSHAYGASNVDVALRPGDVVRFGAQTLEIRATPGHTAGCLSFVTADRGTVFTGDALLVRGAGRTDFQEGSASRLFRSIREQLFTLPNDCVVYPAHDYDGRTSSTIGEERQYNPRIGGEAREEDFVGYMRNLGLPHPKQLAVALPANMRAGQPEDGKPPPSPDWGPVVATYAGLPEIAPEWVAQAYGRRARARRAIGGRVRRRARSHPGCAAHSAGRAARALLGGAEGQARRRRLSDRQAFGDGHRHPRQGGARSHREPSGRHGRLAGARAAHLARGVSADVAVSVRR